MFQLRNKLKLIGSVLGIATNEDSVICVDNFYNIASFSIQENVIDQHLQLSKNTEPLHSFSKSIAISHKNGKVAIGFASTSKGIILKTKPEIIPIASLDWQKSRISKIAFSYDDYYLATGGEDGRTLIYLNENHHLLLSLPPFPDYVSSIAFSESGMLIFSACFAKTAVIFDILKNVKILDLKTDFVVEDAFFYDNDTKIFCTTQSGIFTYDIREEKYLSQNIFENAWVTTCQKLPGEEFAIIGGKYKPLRLVRISDTSIVDVIPSEYTGTTALFLDKNVLYTGYSNGAIEIAQIDIGKEEMLEYLAQDDLNSCFKLIKEKNLFLQILPQYKEKLDFLWKDRLLEAIDLLAKNKLEEAQSLVEPFMLDSNKKEEFDHYLQQKASVARFMDLIERKNYAEAYDLIKEYPYLQNTIAYAQLEELWEKTFELTKKLLAQDVQHNTKKVQELLKPFANIKDKKETIITLLKNIDKFHQADKEFKAKNFVEYFKLCERFPFLQETRNYKSALFVGNQIIQRISALENQNNYDKALEVCKLLNAMFPFRDIAHEKSTTIQLKQEFIQYYSTQQLAKAFEMAETHFKLRSMPEYKTLYKDFRIKCKTAFISASKGDGRSTINTLKEYLHIDCWQDKIASVLKIAYLNEFLQNARQNTKNINWRESFQYYIERYGKDEELKKVASEMDLENVLESIPLKGNPQGYLSAILAESLLCVDNQPLRSYQDKG